MLELSGDFSNSKATSVTRLMDAAGNMPLGKVYLGKKTALVGCPGVEVSAVEDALDLLH